MYVMASVIRSNDVNKNFTKYCAIFISKSYVLCCYHMPDLPALFHIIVSKFYIYYTA